MLTRTAKIPNVTVHPDSDWPGYIGIQGGRAGAWAGEVHTTQKSVDSEKIGRFVELLENNKSLNPIEVFQHKRQVWIVDGHHRLAAYRIVDPSKPVPVWVYKTGRGGGTTCHLQSL